MRKVLIATPSGSGKLDAWYVNSLMESIKLCAINQIELVPIFACYDSLIQRVRNDLAKYAIDNKFDDIIWIDDDMQWNPEWILSLLNSPFDIVGGAARKKTDEIELYNVKINNIKQDQNSTIEVDGIGTGFLKTSIKAIIDLWNKSKEYKNENKECRMVFEVAIENGELIGEDIMLCNKLKYLGYKIYCDINMTCVHVGIKKYYGDFSKYLEKLRG